MEALIKREDTIPTCMDVWEMVCMDTNSSKRRSIMESIRAGYPE